MMILRAFRQRATHNIDMAVEPEEGGNLAHWRLQSTLPVCAKTRRQTITPDGTPGLLCLRSPGRRQTAIFLLQGVKSHRNTLPMHVGQSHHPAGYHHARQDPQPWHGSTPTLHLRSHHHISLPASHRGPTAAHYRYSLADLVLVWPRQVITLPIAKSLNRSKQNKDMHKCSSVYSERGVLLPVLTSGGE